MQPLSFAQDESLPDACVAAEDRLAEVTQRPLAAGIRAIVQGKASSATLTRRRRYENALKRHRPARRDS